MSSAKVSSKLVHGTIRSTNLELEYLYFGELSERPNIIISKIVGSHVNQMILMAVDVLSTDIPDQLMYF